MPVSTLAYAAVRKVDDREMILSSEVFSIPEEVQTELDDTRKRIPSWDAANPVQRIVPVKIIELPVGALKL